MMRDRLIELCENLILSCKASLCEDCEHNNIDYPHCMSVHFADHLLANGVIVPPCKVGDTVYFVSEYVHRVLSDTVENIRIQSNGITVHTVANRHLWGDEVFLTLEEAEQALKGGEE